MRLLITNILCQSFVNVYLSLRDRKFRAPSRNLAEAQVPIFVVCELHHFFHPFVSNQIPPSLAFEQKLELSFVFHCQSGFCHAERQ